MAFELPDADFAGQLGGGGRVTLQGEGTVQGLPVAAPHSGEGDLLACSERLDPPEERRDVKDGDLQTERIPFEVQQLGFFQELATLVPFIRNHFLKCTRSIVHAVNSQVVIQGVTGHAAKHGHLELLYGTVCDWLSCEGICSKAIK